MRCLSLIILLAFIALLAATAYNYIQIEQIKSELSKVKASAGSRTPSADEIKTLNTALARAKEHLSNARKLSEKGEKIKAIHKLDEALRQIETASNIAKNTASDTSSRITEAWDKMRKEGRNVARKMIKLITAFVLMTLVAGCNTAGLVSTQDEVDIGKQAAKEVEQKYPVSKDANAAARVNKIAQEILAHANPRKGIEYQFKVLDIDDINAFALPGGWIYINKGLLDAVKNDDDQLAGVIAHEIGHVQLRHHAKMMGRQTIYGIAIGTLTKGNAQQWANIFANLDLLSWSRKEEYEADRAAIDYTFASTYNPDGIITFFNYLMSKNKESRALPFLRTHPLTENRIARAQDYLSAKRAGKTTGN